ncbi:rhamnosyltransferase, partial [Candidatus Hakubella thermalkaliphila]
MPKKLEYPLVSVVILNYNGMKYINQCLESVLSTDYPNFEVIFVDNSSTDGSLEYVNGRFRGNQCFRIVANSNNYGFAEGNNVGVRHSMGTYIVFLNIDTEVDPRWLKELITVVESDQTIGAAQCKLLMMHDRRRFDSAGGLLDYCGVEWPKNVRVYDLGQYDDVRDIFYAKGAAMLVREAGLEGKGRNYPETLLRTASYPWEI